MNAANPIRDFVTTAFEKVEEPEGDYGKVLKERAVNAYDRYAEQNDLPRQNPKKLKEEIQNLDDYGISSGQSRAVTPGNSRPRVFLGIEWTSRGRQLAGIDEPEDDAQETIDEADDEQNKLADDVWLRDVREYVENNPDVDVYAVMREFELDGDAFTTVKNLIESVRRESEDEDDDDEDDDGAAATGDGGDESGDESENRDESSNSTEPGVDADPGGHIPTEIEGNSREDIREFIEENNATVEEVQEEYWLPPEDVSDAMMYVRRAVARWGDSDETGEDDDEADEDDGVGEDSVREFEAEDIVDDPNKTKVVWYDHVGSGAPDVDVVVVPESEYGPAMELIHPDVEFSNPDGERL